MCYRRTYSTVVVFTVRKLYLLSTSLIYITLYITDLQLASNDDDILEQGFDAENISLPLNLTSAAPSSRLLSEAAMTPLLGAPAPVPVPPIRSLPMHVPITAARRATLATCQNHRGPCHVSHARPSPRVRIVASHRLTPRPRYTAGHTQQPQPGRLATWLQARLCCCGVSPRGFRRVSVVVASRHVASGASRPRQPAPPIIGTTTVACHV